jgi:hypothetical protein
MEVELVQPSGSPTPAARKKLASLSWDHCMERHASPGSQSEVQSWAPLLNGSLHHNEISAHECVQ